MVTFDSLAPTELAGWWAKAIDGEVHESGADFVMVKGGGLTLGFQYVADPTPGKNRVHLDMASHDVEKDIARLQQLGARVLRRHETPGFSWVVLMDPEDNHFCVSRGF
jgi:predicted enzyme related to lactoylglutathione lyase